MGKASRFFSDAEMNSLLRAVRAIFWGPGPSESFHELSDARRVEWGALCVLGAALILFGCWPSLILNFIDGSTPDCLGTLPRLAGMP